MKEIQTLIAQADIEIARVRSLTTLTIEEDHARFEDLQKLEATRRSLELDLAEKL